MSTIDAGRFRNPGLPTIGFDFSEPGLIYRDSTDIARALNADDREGLSGRLCWRRSIFHSQQNAIGQKCQPGRWHTLLAEIPIFPGQPDRFGHKTAIELRL